MLSGIVASALILSGIPGSAFAVEEESALEQSENEGASLSEDDVIVEDTSGFDEEDSQNDYSDSEEKSVFSGGLIEEEPVFQAAGDGENSEYVTVTLNANGGGYFSVWNNETQEYENVQEDSWQVEKGSAFYGGGTPTANPGKYFKGWAYSADATEVLDYSFEIGGYFIADGAKTLYAIWGEAVTVTLNANEGGYFTEWNEETNAWDKQVQEQSIILEKGSAFDGGGTPTANPGKYFKGWAYSPDATEALQYDSNLNGYFTLTEDITLYAIWGEAVTVTLNAKEGGYFTEWNEETNAWDKQVQEQSIILEKGSAFDGGGTPTANPGKYFKGWAYSPDATEVLQYDSNLNGYFTLTEDITLYAIWGEAVTVTCIAINGYLLVWDSNLGKMVESASDSYTAEKGDAFQNRYPTRPNEGKRLKCISTDENGTNIVDSSFVLTEDTTVYYIFEDYVPLTVTWDYNGGLEDGNTSCNDVVSPGDDVFFDDHEPEREGYILVGWSTEKDGSVVIQNPGLNYDDWNGASFEVNEDITFYAKWERVCTVTWDYNGGQSDGKEAYSEDYAAGEEVFVSDAEREGLAFLGWSKNKNGTADDIYLKKNTWFKVTESITLYAVWGEGYTVTWDYGSIIDGEENYRCTYADGEMITPPYIERDGYFLLGWSMEKDGDITIGKHETWELKADITFYAKWTNEVQKVTFDATSGWFSEYNEDEDDYDEVTTVESSMPRGVPIDPELCADFIAEIHNLDESLMLLGWSTSADGSNVVCNSFFGESDPNFIIDQDVILYAVWVPYYKVTFNGNGKKIGGKRIDKFTYYDWPGSVPTGVPDYFIPDEYKSQFVGWSTTADGSNMFDFFTTSVDSDMTVYAIWSDAEYVWADDCSTVTATLPIPDGGTITETVNTTSETVPAKCEEDGATTYTAVFENERFKTQTKTVAIPATGHDYDFSNAIFAWSDDYSQVTASAVCKHNETHILTELVNTTEEVTKPATCEEKGETTYTATFENEGFIAQTRTVDNIEPLGHTWSVVTYRWRDADTKVTASRNCTREGCLKAEEETVNTTEEIVKPASCEENGSKIYSTTDYQNPSFQKQNKTVDIPATGHSWGNWSEWTPSSEDETKEVRRRECTVDGCGKVMTEEREREAASVEKILDNLAGVETAINVLAEGQTESVLDQLLDSICANGEEDQSQKNDSIIEARQDTDENLSEFSQKIDTVLDGKKLVAGEEGDSVSVTIKPADPVTDTETNITVSMTGTAATAAAAASRQLSEDQQDDANKTIKDGDVCKAKIELTNIQMPSESDKSRKLSMDISVKVVTGQADAQGNITGESVISPEEGEILRTPVTVTINLPGDYRGLDLTVKHDGVELLWSWADNDRTSIRFATPSCSPFSVEKSSDQIAAEVLHEQITGLSGTTNKNAISAARAAMTALTERQKELINQGYAQGTMTYDLSGLEQILSEAEASVVTAEIRALSGRATYGMADKAEVDAVKADYEKLTEYGQNCISEADKEALNVAIEAVEHASSLANAVITVSDQTYTGEALTPSVTVKNAEGDALILGEDYCVSFGNNINAGAARVTVTPAENSDYTGSKNATFTIRAASLSGAVISGVTDQSYTGNPIKPIPTVKLGGKTLVAGTDYTVSHANNTNVGTATLTVSGRGNYSGSISKTFAIKKPSAPATPQPAPITKPSTPATPQPAPIAAPSAPIVVQDPITIATSPASVKAKAKKAKVTVSWKKLHKKKQKALLAQIQSIQVQVATDLGFENIVANRNVGKKKTKLAVKLQKKTQYYVRVRYIGNGGYSNWSVVKSVKTK